MVAAPREGLPNSARDDSKRSSPRVDDETSECMARVQPAGRDAVLGKNLRRERDARALGRAELQIRVLRYREARIIPPSVGRQPLPSIDGVVREKWNPRAQQQIVELLAVQLAPCADLIAVSNPRFLVRDTDFVGWLRSTETRASAATACARPT